MHFKSEASFSLKVLVGVYNAFWNDGFEVCTSKLEGRTEANIVVRLHSMDLAHNFYFIFLLIC